MKYSKGKVSDIQIAYIGGGSRGWAWTFMTDLALEDEISGTIRLYDIDRTAAQTNEVIGNHLMNRPEAKGDWKFEVKDSLKEVLTGCDFAVISILPGTFDEMASDVHLPERLGIYQSVGDTAGRGGIISGLRTFPMVVGFAEAIINYANRRRGNSSDQGTVWTGTCSQQCKYPKYSRSDPKSSGKCPGRDKRPV